MVEGEQVLVKMDDLVAAWEAANDRRFIFLSCYKMMTQNVLAAIQANAFEDLPLGVDPHAKLRRILLQGSRNL